MALESIDYLSSIGLPYMISLIADRPDFLKLALELVYQIVNPANYFKELYFSLNS